MFEKTNDDLWLLLGRMDSKLDRVVTDSTDHERRLTKIEKARNIERGVFVSISAAVSLFFTKVLG